MNDILPEASEARKQTIEQMLKQLDKYVVDAINSSETQREFDFSELLTADSLAINNLDKIKQHFENKKYKVEIIHGHDDVIDMGYGRKHPFKSFIHGPKTHRYKTARVIVKW